MKKTLTLAAVLAALYTAPAYAGEHWADGVEWDRVSRLATGAYTSYKHNSTSAAVPEGDTPDHLLCWAVSASNLIAWWQDRVRENGALILPDDAPRGYEVWENVRKYWYNQGGWAVGAVEHWMHGNTISPVYQTRTQEGLEFGGYYNRISGAEFNIGKTHSTDHFMPEGALVDTFRISGVDSEHDYAAASAWIAEQFDNGSCVMYATSQHVMTMYGVNINEKTGLADTIYWTDNNNTVDKYAQDRLLEGDVYTGSSDTKMRAQGCGYYDILYLYSIHSTGIHFNDYDVRVDAERKDSVFSHYCNLIIGDGQEFDLQYDLRRVDAGNPDCPVLGEVITYESDGTVTGRRAVTTGDVQLNSGTLNLVRFQDTRNTENNTEGGSVEGTIYYLGTRNDGQERKVSVQYSGKIADSINITTETGNTLEVTDGHIATFGKLTGSGNLDKTGTGTAEVTETVNLKGVINVREGHFAFGESATLGRETTLNILSAGQVAGKADSAVTLTLDSGVLTNDGVMNLTTTVNAGATLKGSGTFGKVFVSGGELVVGNSPGHQEYTDSLTLSSGKLVFCASGFSEASAGNSTGWDSGAYSTINMRNHELVIGPGGEIIISVGGNALNSLTTGSGDIEMILATNALVDETVLLTLAGRTTFEISQEEGAMAAPAAPQGSLGVDNVQYALESGNLVLRATYGTGEPVPDPATGALTLLALAGLAARRRRK